MPVQDRGARFGGEPWRGCAAVYRMLLIIGPCGFRATAQHFIIAVSAVVGFQLIETASKRLPTAPKSPFFRTVPL